MFSFEKDNSDDENSVKPLTVTELNKEVAHLIDGHYIHGVWVEAEIRNFKSHSSGHWYFSLVDDESQVSGVMWRGQVGSVGFVPKDGNKLLLYGKPTMYAKRGNYQFMALKMLPLGIGARQIALRELKEKLQSEGLFDAEHKKPLPRLPLRIGVVTSATGAAFRDIMNVIERRSPFVEIILRPATVQGIDAGADIAQGVRDLNRYGQVDLMIVGRGGGSEDDLWCFNDEELARAIFASEIPVISAVGHEIDNPISDLVADMRAPTPSAAAELAVIDSTELMIALKEQEARLAKALIKRYKTKAERLQRARAERLPDIMHKRIADYYQQIDIASLRMQRALVRNFNLKAVRYKSLSIRLNASSPLSILSRGYSIVRSKQKIINNAEKLKNGDTIEIQFHKGRAEAIIDKKGRRPKAKKITSSVKPSLFD